MQHEFWNFLQKVYGYYFHDCRLSNLENVVEMQFGTRTKPPDKTPQTKTQPLNVERYQVLPNRIYDIMKWPDEECSYLEMHGTSQC